MVNNLVTVAARQSAALSVNPRYTTLVTLPRAPDPPRFQRHRLTVSAKPRPRRIHRLLPPLPSQLRTPLMRDDARTAN